MAADDDDDNDATDADEEDDEAWALRVVRTDVLGPVLLSSKYTFLREDAAGAASAAAVEAGRRRTGNLLLPPPPSRLLPSPAAAAAARSFRRYAMPAAWFVGGRLLMSVSSWLTAAWMSDAGTADAVFLRGWLSLDGDRFGRGAFSSSTASKFVSPAQSCCNAMVDGVHSAVESETRHGVPSMTTWDPGMSFARTSDVVLTSEDPVITAHFNVGPPP